MLWVLVSTAEKEKEMIPRNHGTGRLGGSKYWRYMRAAMFKVVMASKSTGRASCGQSGQPYCPCETMQVARIDEPYVLRRCTVYCQLSAAVDTSDALRCDDI